MLVRLKNSPLRRAVSSLLLLLLLAAVLPVSGVYLQMPDRSGLVPAICERVIDGDTAWFQVVEEGVPVSHKVRLIGIDTPETVHPDRPVEEGGREAADYVRLMIEGQRVWLEYDLETTDRYGRQLCYVWLEDGRMLNLDLMLLGYARLMTFAPNTKYLEVLSTAGDNAREARLGLWAE